MPLRERKKQATRRTLRRVALELITQRGFSQVTVEDIAEAADVSPRTFFNYFPSKEAALFGADPARIAALRDGLVHQLPGAPALDALRVVLAEDARAVAEELTALGGDPAVWLRRVREARADPHLRAAQSAQMAMVERAIADALAERLGHRRRAGSLPCAAGRRRHRGAARLHDVLGHRRRHHPARSPHRYGFPRARVTGCRRTALCARSPRPRCPERTMTTNGLRCFRARRARAAATRRG